MNKLLLPALFVDIRKRLGKEVFGSFEQIILEKIGERKNQEPIGKTADVTI